MFDRTGSNVARLLQSGGFEVLADMLQSPVAAFQKVYHLVVGCLWTLSVTSEGLGPIVQADGAPVLERALAIVNSDAIGVQVKVFVAGFLMVGICELLGNLLAL